MTQAEKYSVKTFLDVVSNDIYNIRLSEIIVEFIWQNRRAPRAKLILWFLVVDKLKTGNLHHLGLITLDQA